MRGAGSPAWRAPRRRRPGPRRGGSTRAWCRRSARRRPEPVGEAERGLPAELHDHADAGPPAATPEACSACQTSSTSSNVSRRRADAGEHAEGAADVRGVRRAGGSLRGGGVVSMLYDALHRARSSNSSSCAARWSARFALALGAAPIGVFLMLRRMSLIGDAMAHAILPGAAIGFLVAGLSLFAMAGGGLIAGFVVARRRRPDRALDPAQGGCLARRVLPHFARARRHHRLGQGHQRRPAALPVRLGAGGGRSDAAADRRHHQRVAGRSSR